MTAPTAPSTSTDPTAGWGTRDWVAVAHNAIHAAASTPQVLADGTVNPAWLKARGVYNLAMQNVAGIQAAGREGDLEEAKPAWWTSALVAFGNGASLGVVNHLNDTKDFLQGVDVGDLHVPGARESYRGLTAAADIAGNVTTGILAGAGASALGLGVKSAGALSGGLTQAIGGAARAEPGHEVNSAIAGGILGAGAGWLLGAGAEKLIPRLQRSSLGWVRKFFGAGQLANEEAALRVQMRRDPRGFSADQIQSAIKKLREDRVSQFLDEFRAGNAAGAGRKMTAGEEANLRAILEGQGTRSPAQVEEALAEARAGRPVPRVGASPQFSPPSAGVRPRPPISEQISALENSAGRPLEAGEKAAVIQRELSQPPPPLRPVAGTEGRGFEATGTRATPAVPASQPTLAEMSGMANLQHTAGNPSELPTGKGETLPYYTRGGRVEQSLGPAPTSSPKTPSRVDAVMADWIKRAQAGDPEAVQYMRSIYNLLRGQ